MPNWATPVKDRTGGVNFRLGRIASIRANYVFFNDVSQFGATERLPAGLLAYERMDRREGEAVRRRVWVGVRRGHPERFVIGALENGSNV